jgi:hypothetical protein
LAGRNPAGPMIEAPTRSDPPEESAMPTNPEPDEQLREPHRVDSPDGSRGDGRPTGSDPLREAPPADAVPTVAPEEEGETPATEHAPGGDL